MQVLQRAFCVILTSLSVLPHVSPILLKELMNTTVDDAARQPTFTENLLSGLDRAEMLSGSSLTIPIVEVRNTAALGSRGGTKLNEFRAISMDIIIYRDGPVIGYISQCVTIHGSASTWGSWGSTLEGFRSLDAATARRAFAWHDIVMDEEDAYAILRTAGFNGPWACIYLCRLPATGLLFYVFQQPQQPGSLETIYQIVGLADGSVRLSHGAVQHPCTQLTLDLTTNVTLQAEPANHTNLQVSPSGSTNVTSQKAFEVDGAFSEGITAF